MFGKMDIWDVIKGLFRFLAVAVVILVAGVLLGRMITARVPADYKVLSGNETLRDSYETYGDSLTVFRQEQNTITRNEGNYGYFTMSDAVFLPEAGQIQILIRYNDSTLEALETDYSLDFTPDPEKDYYDISLVVATDLTPDDTTDNLESSPDSVKLTRVTPTSTTLTVHRGRYSYRRLVFDGIPFDDNLLAVYTDFFYLGDLSYRDPAFDIYRDEAYGTLCIYAFTEKKDNIYTKLSAKDVESILAEK